MASFYHAPLPRLARMLIPVAVALLAGAAAGSAQAAQVRVDRACFADPADRRETVRVTGSGFPAGTAYRVLLDGRPLRGGGGRTSTDGRMTGRFAAPAVSRGGPGNEHTFRVVVVAGDTRGGATFKVSRVAATFTPGRGNPRTLRVRFAVWGFRLQGARRPPVYLHYVRPDGRLARTVRLGTAGGACGRLRTRTRRLFPFRAIRGAWRLQFDSRRRYDRGTPRSSFLFSRVGVDIR